MTTIAAIRSAFDAQHSFWTWTEGTIGNTPRVLGVLPGGVGAVELRGEPLIAATYLGVLSPTLLTAAAANGVGMALLLHMLISDWNASEEWLARALRTASEMTAPIKTITYHYEIWTLRLTVNKPHSTAMLQLERM